MKVVDKSDKKKKNSLQIQYNYYARCKQLLVYTAC